MVRDVPFGSSLSPVSKSDLDHDRRGASLVFCGLPRWGNRLAGPAHLINPRPMAGGGFVAP